MRIITDDKKYCHKLFPSSSNYEDLSQDILQHNIFPLIQDLLQDQQLFQSNISLQSIWEYGLVTNYAPASQFKILREHAQNNILPGGILCLADAGHGFSGYRKRNWTSVHGNLHFSVFLKPDQPIDHFETGFTILSAISVTQAINDLYYLKEIAHIRWINDIVIGSAKVGGVLTHTFSQGNMVTGAILGIGINVETTPEIEKDMFVSEAVSLFDYLTEPDGNVLSKLLQNLLKHLTINYQLLLENRYDDLLSIYRTHSIIIGKVCSVYSDPLTGNPEKLLEGKIIEIGNNLEIYFEDLQEPVRSGRIIIK